LMGKHLVLVVSPASAAVDQVSAGYSFVPGDGGRKVYKSPVDNPPESMQILAANEYDDMLVAPEAAYLIKNAIA